MAKKTYVGVNNVAQEVSKMYVGVGNVARKVTKAYVGVNGVAEQVYDSSGGLKIVTWNGGTDAEIVAMVEAADRGEINLSDYWSVGDERTVSLSGMSFMPGMETHNPQDVQFVLMDTNKFSLVNPTASGQTKSKFAIGMKDLLNETGRMYTPNTSYVYWSSSDPVCTRRTWLDSEFYDAVPSTLKPIFKQFYAPYHNTAGYFCLWGQKEILGSSTYYCPYSEVDATVQMDYYKTRARQIKYINGSATTYWTRSKSSSDNKAFCVVLYNGSGSHQYMQNTPIGISPFGVI